MEKTNNKQKQSTGKNNIATNRAKRIARRAKRRAIKRVLPLMQAGNTNTSNPGAYNNPTEFRKYSGKQLINELNIFNKHLRDRYLVGLIHPDVAVRDGLSPKLYHDVPIPTTTYGIYGSYTATTNASGNLLVSFATPGQPGVVLPMQNITVNNSAGLNGTVGVAGNNFVNVLPVVNVPTQRYRLVSSLLRVSYTGRLLDQAGKIYSCATYDPLNIKYYSAVTQSQVLIDRFGDFSLIKNGLWNTTVDVTSPNHAIECLWVPTDAYSYIFQQQFSYAGTSYTLPDTLMAPNAEGARLGYVVALQGLPAATACVTIECWSNYELIADPSVAPYMVHSADLIWDSDSQNKVHDVLNKELKTNGLIRQPSSTKSNWLEIINSLMTNGVPLLTKLISMF